MIFKSTASRQNKPFYEQNLSKPNKPSTLLPHAGSVLRCFTPKTTIACQYAERFGNPRRRFSGKPTQNEAWLGVLLTRSLCLIHIYLTPPPPAPPLPEGTVVIKIKILTDTNCGFSRLMTWDDMGCPSATT